MKYPQDLEALSQEELIIEMVREAQDGHLHGDKKMISSTRSHNLKAAKLFHSRLNPTTGSVFYGWDPRNPSGRVGVQITFEEHRINMYWKFEGTLKTREDIKDFAVGREPFKVEVLSTKELEPYLFEYEPFDDRD